MADDWSILRVIDGGLGMYASKKAARTLDGHPLWSGSLVRDDPELVKAIHTEFLDAGADVLETVSYQLHVPGICSSLGLSPSEAGEMITESVLLARSAVDAAWPRLKKEGRPRPLVAGCVGPYGCAYKRLAEYTGEYTASMSAEALAEWHRPRLAALHAAGDALDLLAFDTVPALAEARVLARMLREFPSRRAWICFSSLDGSRSCAGDDLARCAEEVAAADGVVALGVNCCLPPRLVAPALAAMARGANGKPLVAFPNTGQRLEPETMTFVEDEQGSNVIADYVPAWAAAGCRWIGGCCGSEPPDIAAVAERVNALRAAQQ